MEQASGGPSTTGEAIEKHRSGLGPEWTDEALRDYLKVSEADWPLLKQEPYPDGMSPTFHDDLDRIADKHGASRDRLRDAIGDISPSA